MIIFSKLLPVINLNINRDNASGKQFYEDYMKERNTTLYNSVELKEE